VDCDYISVDDAIGVSSLIAEADDSMKIALMSAVAATALTGMLLAAPTQEADPQPGRPRVPVLAELFTSEGCSSCPAADDLLRRLIAEQPIDGVEVLGLSEHVDYWDRLGWKDPFSSRRFTDRQQAYARVFGSDRIYTPQLVIDGRLEVVGSDWQQVRRAIVESAKRPHCAIVVSASVSADGRTATVRAAVTGVPREVSRNGATLLLAVVEDDLATDVARGENARRRLHHAAVVRVLEEAGSLGPASTSGEFTQTIDIESGWRRDRLRIVAFLQNARTRAVVGAGSARL